MARTPVDRAERHMSHALVELRKYRWFPLGVKSAVLLDLSQTGFKAEFTGQVSCEIGQRFYLQIPLAPLGISMPILFSSHVTIRWFDQNKMRIGGTFDNLDSSSQVFLDQIISKLKEDKPV